MFGMQLDNVSVLLNSATAAYVHLDTSIVTLHADMCVPQSLKSYAIKVKCSQLAL